MTYEVGQPIQNSPFVEPTKHWYIQRGRDPKMSARSISGTGIFDKNRRFLRGIDPQYFRHVAQVNDACLEGGTNHHAALALRLAYSHALESFFALAAAAFQASQCPLGWLLRYSTRELYSVTEKVTRGYGLHIGFEGAASWRGLADAVFGPADIEASEKTMMCEDFGGLWVRFAHDFLDQKQLDEYNSIKHGFRAAAGGFVLRMGLQPAPGVPAPESAMQTIGASHYGSSFYTIEKPVGGPIDFRPRHGARNWDPENLSHGVDLLVTSMSNVLALLKGIAGEDPESITFARPEDRNQYHLPWRNSSGVSSSNMDTTVSATDIDPSDPADIRRRLTA